MRNLIFPALLVIAPGIFATADLSAVASAEAGLQTQASVSTFRVVFYPNVSQAAQMESGTLEIERDVFRFSSMSGQYAWTVDIGAVESIVVEPFAGPFRSVTSIVIESNENGRRVRRRIAGVDDVSLNERAMLTGMMRLRVEQFRAARSSSQ